MDDKNLSASLLPVAVKKKKAGPRFPAVQLVSEWALLTAGFFIAAFALAYALPPPLSLSRLMTDDAEVAAVADETTAAIWRVVAWCTSAQSATAALAQLLPGRRRRGRIRRALAYVALAVAAANHVMFASGIALVVTTTAVDSGRDAAVWYWFISGAASFVVILAVGDLVCFRALTGWRD